jgi:glycosyltransferase involved in cell wall biosynthesis
MKKWKNKKRIVVDFDDAEWMYEFDSYFCLTHYAMDTTRLCYEACCIADLITCTTKHIREAIMEFKQNSTPVLVIPNAIDFTLPMWNKEKKDHEKYRIGYLGGSTSVDVALKLLPQIQEIDIEWHFVGLTEMLVQPIKKGNIIFHQFYPLDRYAEFYAGLDAVIVFNNGEGFRGYKSSLKLIEASGYDLNVIVPNIYPYKEDFTSDYFIELNDSLIDSVKQSISHKYNTREWVDKTYAKETINNMRKEYYGILCTN